MAPWERWVVGGTVGIALAAVAVAIAEAQRAAYETGVANGLAQAQLNAIRAEQRALRVEAHSIDSNAAATLLAREQYQLVAPGQSLIQVLPGTSTASGTQYSGDPGLQPLAPPSSLASLPAASTTHPHTSPTKGFVSRLLHTLEFWH